MRRILVIGCPGAGKSSLARRLSRRLALPLVHLDQEYFSPDWVEPPRAVWRDKVRRLAAAEAWVMDGNYSSTFDLRVPRAEAVIWLDIPRWLCLLSVTARVLRHWGRTRPDLGDGCVERFDASFMRFIWDFPDTTRPKIATMMLRLRPDQKAFILRSRAELPALEEHLAHLRSDAPPILALTPQTR